MLIMLSKYAPAPLTPPATCANVGLLKLAKSIASLYSLSR